MEKSRWRLVSSSSLLFSSQEQKKTSLGTVNKYIFYSKKVIWLLHSEDLLKEEQIGRNTTPSFLFFTKAKLFPLEAKLWAVYMICSTQMEFLKSIDPSSSQFHAREIAAFPTFTPHSSGIQTESTWSAQSTPFNASIWLQKVETFFGQKRGRRRTPRLQALGNLIIRVQEMPLGLYPIIGPPTNNCSTDKRQKNLTRGKMTLYLFMKNNN